jgi:hypothetical protein
MVSGLFSEETGLKKIIAQQIGKFAKRQESKMSEPRALREIFTRRKIGRSTESKTWVPVCKRCARNF